MIRGDILSREFEKILKNRREDILYVYSMSPLFSMPKIFIDTNI